MYMNSGGSSDCTVAAVAVGVGDGSQPKSIAKNEHSSFV